MTKKTREQFDAWMRANVDDYQDIGSETLFECWQAAQSRNAALPPNWIKAMQLAMDICDLTPGFCHETDDGPLGKIGNLVNCQDDGQHGYALIRDALEQMSAVEEGDDCNDQ